jgi:hypothetical protein
MLTVPLFCYILSVLLCLVAIWDTNNNAIPRATMFTALATLALAIGLLYPRV